ncbi:UNVERIFIED_CONTAM: hypothetical protein Sradi_1899400 [Sesamum radiatum]|uniref:Integrase zinc-binding domain-containing protein n=1 Tax=Sesamum radiatum TaxID=300843 RepID=A0AAW2TZ98_SESRA
MMKRFKQWKKPILEFVDAHQSRLKLYFRIKRIGYYWPTMVKDCMDFARICQACQFHTNFIHKPPEPLHPTIISWPFDAWGLVVVGAMTKSFGDHLYILAAIDYFSKWAEVVSLKKNAYSINSLCTGLRSGGSPSIGAANPIIEDTTVRMPTQSTPCALVYEVEAVLPLELQIPSLRIAIQEGLTEEENARIQLKELEALDEKRLEAQQRLECYQARLSKEFNKKLRPCSFQVGDLVFAVRRPIITTHRTGKQILVKMG